RGDLKYSLERAVSNLLIGATGGRSTVLAEQLDEPTSRDVAEETWEARRLSLVYLRHVGAVAVQDFHNVNVRNHRAPKVGELRAGRRGQSYRRIAVLIGNDMPRRAVGRMRLISSRRLGWTLLRMDFGRWSGWP